jgi:hypothetical protein
MTLGAAGGASEQLMTPTSVRGHVGCVASGVSRHLQRQCLLGGDAAAFLTYSCIAQDQELLFQRLQKHHHRDLSSASAAAAQTTASVPQQSQSAHQATIATASQPFKSSSSTILSEATMGSNTVTPQTLLAGAREYTKLFTGGAKIGIPRLTPQEQASPLGASLTHVVTVFYSMTQWLMQERAAAAATAAAGISGSSSSSPCSSCDETATIDNKSSRIKNNNDKNEKATNQQEPQQQPSQKQVPSSKRRSSSITTTTSNRSNSDEQKPAAVTQQQQHQSRLQHDQEQLNTDNMVGFQGNLQQRQYASIAPPSFLPLQNSSSSSQALALGAILAQHQQYPQQHYTDYRDLGGNSNFPINNPDVRQQQQQQQHQQHHFAPSRQQPQQSRNVPPHPSLPTSRISESTAPTDSSGGGGGGGQDSNY